MPNNFKWRKEYFITEQLEKVRKGFDSVLWVSIWGQDDHFVTWYYQLYWQPVLNKGKSVQNLMSFRSFYYNLTSDLHVYIFTEYNHYKCSCCCCVAVVECCLLLSLHSGTWKYKPKESKFLVYYNYNKHLSNYCCGPTGPNGNNQCRGRGGCFCICFV